jgi:hypothetical protein
MCDCFFQHQCTVCLLFEAASGAFALTRLILGLALICILDVGLVAGGARAAPRRRRPLVLPPPAVLAAFWRVLLRQSRPVSSFGILQPT